MGRATEATTRAAVEVRRAKLQAELERIVRVLVEQYDPECVILYGSFAHGDIHEWSDLDLCVIKRTEKRFIERLEEVGLLTLPRVGCQILVYTPEELEAVKQQGHYFDCLRGCSRIAFYVSPTGPIGYAVSSDRSEQAHCVASASGTPSAYATSSRTETPRARSQRCLGESAVR